MLTCPFCGESNPPTSRHCSDCGAALDNDPPNPYADDADNRSAAGAGTADETIESELADLLRAGQKIQAIKLYREQSGCGLKESKEYVEALARQHGIEASGGGCAGMLLLCCFVVAIVVMIGSM